jgi:hypothetical protein
MTSQNLEEEKTEKREKLSLNEKELLYCLFYEVTSEIKNLKIEIEEEDYKNNIRSISSNQLIEYLHDSIKILLKKKFEEGKEEGKKEEKLNLLKKKIPIEKNELNQLETYIKKLEEKERNLTKLIFRYKLQKNGLKNKIADLLDIEDEYEEMKEKLKYEDGKFLNNDRKDNEIIILRKENINLKNYISENEKKLKTLELNLSEKEKNIISLENKIQKLNLKLEEKQKEIYSTINFEANNNTNISTNILSVNKQDSINNENNKSYSPNLKLFQMQKIKSKLFKKSKKNNVEYLNKNDYEQNKLFFIHKYLSSRQNHNTSLNNSLSIKIAKLPIKDIKIKNNKGMPLIKNNSEVNILKKNNNMINIYQSGFNSCRKSTDVKYKI